MDWWVKDWWAGYKKNLKLLLNIHHVKYVGFVRTASIICWDLGIFLRYWLWEVHPIWCMVGLSDLLAGLSDPLMDWWIWKLSGLKMEGEWWHMLEITDAKFIFIGVPAPGRGVGTRRSLRSHPIQTILWSYDPKRAKVIHALESLPGIPWAYQRQKDY